MAKPLKFVTGALLAMVACAILAKPARADFVKLGYRYLIIDDSVLHVGRLQVFTTRNPDNSKAKVPKGLSLGIGIGIGYGGPVYFPSNKSWDKAVYIDFPIVYEYVLGFGLGFSAGMSGVLLIGDRKQIGGGVSLADVGLTYYFKNGFNLYTNADVGYTTAGFLYGGGGGFGFSF